MDSVLVLLHGYPFDYTMWAPVRAHLPPNVKVYTPDLLGSAHALPAEPGLEVLADEVVSGLHKQGMARAVVAGFSMGGYVALALAERHPAFLSGLALINSQTLPDTEQVRAGRRALIDQIRQKGWPVATEAAIPKLFATPSEELAKFARRGAERAGPSGLCWALEAMARRPDRTRVLVDCPQPVLIVHSTEDQFIPVDRARQLAASRPQTSYSELRGLGHGSPLEDPVAVSAALRSLLDRCQNEEHHA